MDQNAPSIELVWVCIVRKMIILRGEKSILNETKNYEFLLDYIAKFIYFTANEFVIEIAESE